MAFITGRCIRVSLVFGVAMTLTNQAVAQLQFFRSADSAPATQPTTTVQLPPPLDLNPTPPSRQPEPPLARSSIIPTGIPNGANPVAPAQFAAAEISPPDAMVPGAAAEAIVGDLPPSPPGPVPAMSTAGPIGTPILESSHVSGAPMIQNGYPIMSEPTLESSFDQHLIDEGGEVLYSTNAWFRRGFWYTQQEVITMIRTETEEIDVAADNSAAGTVMLTSKSVDPSFTGGTRMTLGRFLGQDHANRDHTLEMTFLGLFEYSDSESLVGIDANSLQTALAPGALFIVTTDPTNFSTVSGVAGLVVGPDVDGFSDARRYDLRYDSDFNSWEMNYRIFTRPVRDRLALQPNGSWMHHATPSRLRSFLVGLRAISIAEMMRFQASFSDGLTQGTYQVQTDNDAYGLQFGGDVLENYSTWTFGLRYKAGALFNWADRNSKHHSRVANSAGDVTETLVRGNASGENLVALVEVGLGAAYQIRPNFLIRAGYDAMYLTGIATAPENAGLELAFPGFEAGGDALFHGVSVGFEMLW